ncbi:hypothetical protein [Catellatospora bangladeshensis]|uniref:Uncharacterized protein n=1 Tax=Catellatospora bangladeshensis TaxID=310355 RepID=A0A8J3JMG4_9ACTN|nr:hypothetical protein Cba03nite_47050 [Catellatospora bangladeshensis]
MRKRTTVSAGLAAVVVAAATTAILVFGPTPADAAVGGSGPYPADYETSSTLPNHTIYRPQTLPSQRMPVFVWGNGGCSGNGLDQQNFLREIASHGFLAIANGAPGGSGSTNSSMHTASMDWVVGEQPAGQQVLRKDRHLEDRRGRLLVRRPGGVRRRQRPTGHHRRHLQQRVAQRRR